MIEYCVTINPDPKKRIGNKQYAAISPRKQYQYLVYYIAKATVGKIDKFRFIFEVSGSGQLHAHGSIYIEPQEDNTHMFAVKSFQHKICTQFARNTNSQYFMDVCCKIKIRDDNIVSDKYKTWEDYLNKHQANRPQWMLDINSTDIPRIGKISGFNPDTVDQYAKELNVPDLDNGFIKLTLD